ncbi:hypothetical protein MLD38_025747 [Melastoma candidum]|uniref:Uncharacterized protein n=1 Tax=Melastoma candidum TaxID=119954 RepID=A0ACB9NWE7_9MYRT|nr:hypothetical protein MLD38_025747 [Melastoma candidum]
MHTIFQCLFLLLFFCCFLGSDSCTFTITNNCPITIWPGIGAGSGMPQLPSTGFVPGQSARIPSVPGWSGRIWARTGCKFDEMGTSTCLTGDCGGKLECSGIGAMPPASLFEITLGKGTDKDFDDVSIVDGCNLPLGEEPQGVYAITFMMLLYCVWIRAGCPKELQVVGGDGEKGSGGVIVCKSACKAFGLDQYCCSGEFANHNLPSILLLNHLQESVPKVLQLRLQ